MTVLPHLWPESQFVPRLPATWSVATIQHFLHNPFNDTTVKLHATEEGEEVFDGPFHMRGDAPLWRFQGDHGGRGNLVLVRRTWRVEHSLGVRPGGQPPPLQPAPAKREHHRGLRLIAPQRPTEREADRDDLGE